MKPIIYPNLDYWMWKTGVRACALARALDITHSTMSRKLHGKGGLYLEEAIKIREALGVDIPLEKLFSREVMEEW